MGVNGGVSLLRGVCGGWGEGGWGWVFLLQDKFVLSRNLGYNTRRDHQVAKRSSDPWVSESESESELLLVTRSNDNHSPGPVMREVSP